MKKLILSLFALLVFAISGCNAVAIQYTSPIYALGTIIDVTFYNENNYMEHYNKIKSLYQRVDRVSSDFSSNPSRNSVYDLNQKREVEADPLLVDMVTRAIELKKETKGYFNPFIGRLSHIWKDAIRDKKLPDKALIEAEVEIMNNTSIQVEGNKLTQETGWGVLSPRSGLCGEAMIPPPGDPSSPYRGHGSGLFGGLYCPFMSLKTGQLIIKIPLSWVLDGHC